MNELYIEWIQQKEAIDAATKRKREIEQEICQLEREAIADKLDKDYGTGTVNLASDTYKVKITYAKKVTWDEKKLADTWDKITAHGDKPEQYIERKLSVSETKYNAFPDSIRDVFTDARTVSVATPSFTITPKE